MRTPSEMVEEYGYARFTRGWEHWLPFVHAVNAAAKERGEEPVFGEPDELDDEVAGTRLVERYPEARIIFRDDVTITADSDRARELMEGVTAEDIEAHSTAA